MSENLNTTIYNDYEGNVISKGNQIISYSDAEFIKNVICWIADNGKVSKRLKTDLTKKRQQDVIDLCKQIKLNLNWK